jgi:PAB-dependent poly(A)-specific ribonuclease subunit 2
VGLTIADDQPLETKFAELLRTSLLRESSTKATCASCKQFVPLASRRIIDGELEDSLPAVLSVNAMVSTPEIFGLWQDKPTRGGAPAPRFLPKQLVIRADDAGEIAFAEEGEGLVYDVTVSRRSDRADLQSIVVQIQETPDSQAHLLSYVKSESAVEQS